MHVPCRRGRYAIARPKAAAGGISTSRECIVAVSKKRQKKNDKPQFDVAAPTDQNPSWLVPTAVTLLVIGPVWIVVYYIAAGNYPIPGIGNINMFIGFGFLAASMVLFSRWK